MEITTERPIDGQALRTVPGDHADPSDRAAQASSSSPTMPARRRLVLVDAVRVQGSGVVSIDPYQPSFGEVFAAIVERSEQERAAVRAAEGGMNSLAKAFTRISAVMLKELRELARRPGAIASLMLGPLVVVALFGLGYSGTRRPFERSSSSPPDVGYPADIETYRQLGGAAIHVVAS